jgi:hypothetical protein
MDESLRTRVDGPGTYVLAAVVCPPERCDEIRGCLRCLLRKRQPRLHWKEETDRRRDLIAGALGSWGLPALVVVGRPMDPRKQERARRLCFAGLVDHLGTRGVSRLWIDARTPSLNRRDRQMVDALRSQRRLPHGLRVDVARPLQEPMLWLPDIVAGAVKAGLDGRPAWRAMINESIHEVNVALK